jgi:hypothetical protein
MRAAAISIALAFVAGCGSAPRPRPRPRVVVIRPIEEPQPRPEPLEARISHARARAGADLIVDRRLRVDGEARLHLVLERGRCYRVWVGADRGLSAAIEDEHGLPVAPPASGWLDEVCPRWSGSFALVLTPDRAARSAAVLVTARPLDPAR